MTRLGSLRREAMEWARDDMAESVIRDHLIGRLRDDAELADAAITEWAAKVAADVSAVLFRLANSWWQDAQARPARLRPSVVGGVPVDYSPPPPTCPDCGLTDPDAEVVYAHLWTHPGRDRRLRERRGAA